MNKKLESLIKELEEVNMLLFKYNQDDNPPYSKIRRLNSRMSNIIFDLKQLENN